MQKTIFLFAGTLFLASCNDAPKKEAEKIIIEGPKITISPDSAAKHLHTAHAADSSGVSYEESIKLDNYIVTTAPDADVTTINKTCVLIVYPTTEQGAKMQQQMGEDFSTVADDNAFYQSQFADAAKNRNIETITSDKRYIKFVGINKTILFDRCAKVSGGWMMIMFRPDSLPRFAGYAEADTALTAYFGK